MLKTRRLYVDEIVTMYEGLLHKKYHGVGLNLYERSSLVSLAKWVDEADENFLGDVTEWPVAPNKSVA